MYYCEFPNCNFETKNKSQIHNHHIIPKELNGKNDKYNTIRLCPNCHSKIYIPESKSGIHSIKNSNSIILNGWLMSTGGKVLNYIDSSGKEQFYKKEL